MRKGIVVAVFIALVLLLGYLLDLVSSLISAPSTFSVISGIIIILVVIVSLFYLGGKEVANYVNRFVSDEKKKE